ncbi:PX domain protein (macronuclear) [Tetrahymena thermophila SB210]|uniref:PX domain protein n=1 Tax=Tetrahymena thermophila (strain SB210) TaxID=312017 RepID=Q22BN6_TETTS|nr:PX domain protein [Tetrahymena thermophila SB210]EAR82693.1 PX domain protein [Tetrahymena thermophila SB210]|eukprot:XP_001030356.1 PX domain protein [Tetrahymena thermophila SB210]
MNSPNQALLEEPYLLVKVVSGFNLLKGIREKRDTEEYKSKDSLFSQNFRHQDTNQLNFQDKNYLFENNELQKQDSLHSNSFLKQRNNQNQQSPFSIFVSVHTSTNLLFETKPQKTYDGAVRFQDRETQQFTEESQVISKEKTQSLNDLSESGRFILHKRWKSSQPPKEQQSEKKIFLKDLSKYIIVDVMDSDCYMEKTLMNTQVIPVEFFLVPTNSGKKWNIWLKMNKITEDSNNFQEQETLKSKNQEVEKETNFFKTRSQTIYYPSIIQETQISDKYSVNRKNNPDDQISKLTGINSSNFEDYFVQIEKPIPFYISDNNILSIMNQKQITDGISQTETKYQRENLSPQSQTRNVSLNQQNDFKQSKNLNDKVNQGSQNDSCKVDQLLDKNFSWLQLEIVTMDIGSLLKLTALIISIEEVDRAGKPNIFVYNIAVTRNDGLTYLVKRRYKQFRELKNQLQKNIKKVEFVSFPSRSISKITSLFSKQSYLDYFQQAQQRLEKLQLFLNFINDLDEVYKEESFIQFYTLGGQLDLDVTQLAK